MTLLSRLRLSVIHELTILLRLVVVVRVIPVSIWPYMMVLLFIMLTCFGRTAPQVWCRLCATCRNSLLMVQVLLMGTCMLLMCWRLHLPSFRVSVSTAAIALDMLTTAWACFVGITWNVLLTRLLTLVTVLVTLALSGGLRCRRCLATCMDLTLTENVVRIRAEGVLTLLLFSISLAELLFRLIIRHGGLSLLWSMMSAVLRKSRLVLLAFGTILGCMLSTRLTLLLNALWPMVLWAVDAVMNWTVLIGRRVRILVNLVVVAHVWLSVLRVNWRAPLMLRFK